VLTARQDQQRGRQQGVGDPVAETRTVEEGDQGAAHGDDAEDDKTRYDAYGDLLPERGLELLLSTLHRHGSGLGYPAGGQLPNIAEPASM
jgi:hypothetical protein